MAQRNYTENRIMLKIVPYFTITLIINILITYEKNIMKSVRKHLLTKMINFWGWG